MKHDERCGLSDEDIRLLQALASESDMTAVAKSLFLSPRHARRRIRGLLARLGVESTRAAVAVAAAHGFIHEPPSILNPCDANPASQAGT